MLPRSLTSAFIALLVSCSTSHPGGDDSSGSDGGRSDGGGAESDGGGESSWFVCDEPSDCVLTSVTCCGVCGSPSASDMIGVRQDHLSEYRAQACDGDPICPACAVMPNPNLIATCGSSGRCEAVDLSTVVAVTCSGDADCKVRTPECCECGADTNRYSLIAVSRSQEGQLVSLVCDSDSACPECLPVYDPEVSAVCNAGRCELEGVSP